MREGSGPGKPFLLLTLNDEFPYTPPRLKRVLIPSPRRDFRTMIGRYGIPGFDVYKVDGFGKNCVHPSIPQDERSNRMEF